jgi:hypothetical protein
MPRLQIEHTDLTFLFNLLSREMNNIHEKLNGDQAILLTLDDEFELVAEENACKRLLASCMTEENRCRRLLASRKGDDE